MQRAWQTLVRARSRADAILAAAEVTYPAQRSGGLLPVTCWLDCANDPRNRGLLSGNAYRAAGPVHPLARLLWLAGPEAQPWVPSLEQHDARVAEWRELMRPSPGAGPRRSRPSAGRCCRKRARRTGAPGPLVRAGCKGRDDARAAFAGQRGDASSSRPGCRYARPRRGG